MTSVRKSYIQNLLKNRKLLPAGKLGNIFAFDKESKRKLLSLMSADSSIKNKCILVRLWVKVFVSQRWIQEYSAYTIIQC